MVTVKPALIKGPKRMCSMRRHPDVSWQFQGAPGHLWAEPVTQTSQLRCPTGHSALPGLRSEKSR